MQICIGRVVQDKHKDRRNMGIILALYKASVQSLSTVLIRSGYSTLQNGFCLYDEIQNQIWVVTVDYHLMWSEVVQSKAMAPTLYTSIAAGVAGVKDELKWIKV